MNTFSLVYVTGEKRRHSRMSLSGIHLFSTAWFQLIGVGKTECCLGLPSLRTGQAGLPHPALQSVVLPCKGLT